MGRFDGLRAAQWTRLERPACLPQPGSVNAAAAMIPAFGARCRGIGARWIHAPSEQARGGHQPQSGRCASRTWHDRPCYAVGAVTASPAGLGERPLVDGFRAAGCIAPVVAGRIGTTDKAAARRPADTGTADTACLSLEERCHDRTQRVTLDRRRAGRERCPRGLGLGPQLQQRPLQRLQVRGPDRSPCRRHLPSRKRAAIPSDPRTPSMRRA